MLFASQQTERSMRLSLTTPEFLYHLLPGFSCFVAPFDLKLGISGHVFQFHFSLYNLKSSCIEFSVMFNGTTSAALAVAYISVQVIYKTHATPSSCSTSSWVWGRGTLTDFCPKFQSFANCITKSSSYLNCCSPSLSVHLDHAVGQL